MSDINIGAIGEALNNKVDLPSPTVPQDAVDYVIDMQRPTAENNYTWYRKYKSGWVEQGGTLSGKTVTFPVPFLNIPTVVTSLHSADTAATRNNMISSVTTTSFSGGQLGTNKDWTGAYGDMTGDWAAFGIAA